MRMRGFTLVEVLVALVIVAVGMGALLAAVGSAADTTSYLRDKTFAQWVALNHVTEVRLQNASPTKGKTSGETEFAGHRWQWEQEVTALDVPGVLRMDVKVRMADKPPAKNAPWIGNAIGVIGDAIARSVSPVSMQSTWEFDPRDNPAPPDNPGSKTPDNGTDDTPAPPPPIEPPES